MQKVTLIPLIPAGLATTLAIMSIIYPESFHLPKSGIGLTGVVSALLGITTGVTFLFRQRLTHREQIRKKRDDHFRTLRTNVFEPWINQTAVPSKTRDGCNDSFEDLYVNIFDTLKSNLRFQRVKSHFENDEYKEVKTLLDNMERKSTDLNRNISHFMGSVKRLIITSVFPRDICSVAAFAEIQGSQTASWL